ncbi:MAG: hypothetical protein EXS46_03830 [Candidatus Taylorbacteria bacterium]|nr:hypothetical protein [Candidatus Taylorbacteria bacterium]
MNFAIAKQYFFSRFTLFCFAFLLSFFAFNFAEAQLFNSSSYEVIQPVVNTSQTGSSASFQVTSSITQINVFPTDLNGPTISGVHAPVVSSASAEVKWVTNIVASSTLSWGTTSGVYTNATSSSAMTIEHALMMGSLSESTIYYYKVTSYDALGNASTSDNGGAGFSLTTSASSQTTTTSGGGGTRTVYFGDPTSPIIGTIDVTNITSSTATISFTTSKHTNEVVQYGIGNATDFTAGKTDIFQKVHTVTITNLATSTEYTFKVKALDIFGFSNQSTNLTFKTTVTGGPTSTPVSFQTTEVTERLSDTDNSTIQKFSSAVKVAPLTFVTSAIQAFLSAIADNPVSKDVNTESFTAAVSEAASKIVSTPKITEVDVALLPDAHSVVISWSTDKKADSLVAFSKWSDYKPGKENPYSITAGFPDEQTVSHKVTLENLESNTLYHFQTRSKSLLGPVALSGDKTFTTLSLIPQISNVKFTAINDNSASVEWETNLPTKNSISITNNRTGKEQRKDDISFLKIHQIDLKDFTPGTAYTLRLKAIDESGKVSFPSILPFTTAMSTTPPKISQVRITASLVPDQLDTVQTIVSWKTDKPATSQVFYGEGVAKILKQSTTLDYSLVTDHIVITTALKPGQVYQVQARSGDSQDHKSQSDSYTTLTPKPKQSAIDLIFKNLDSTFGFLKF